MSEPNLVDTPEKEFTPEQLKEMRANMKNYYKEQIDVLKLQDEFERLHASIAENQAKTMMNQIRMAQMAAGPPKETPGQDGEKKPRKLKED
jgi:CHASE3 domain sensor protein